MIPIKDIYCIPCKKHYRPTLKWGTWAITYFDNFSLSGYSQLDFIEYWVPDIKVIHHEGFGSTYSQYGFHAIDHFT